MNFKLKLVVLFISLSAIPLLFVGVVSLSNSKKALTNEALSKLNAISQLQKERMENFLVKSEENLGSISSLLQMRLELDKFIKDGNAGSRDFIIEDIISAQNQLQNNKNIYILDLAGKVVASTDREAINRPFPYPEIFEMGKRKNQVAITGTNQNGQLTQFLAGPITLHEQELGVTVMESSPETLKNFFASDAGLGKTGEVLLIKKDTSGNPIFLNQPRFETDFDQSNVKNPDTVVNRALNSPGEVYSNTIDSRSIPVFASSKAIRDTGWVLLVKADQDEILRQVTDLQTSIITLMVIVIIFSSILAYLTAKNISDPIEELAQAARRMARTDFSDISLVNINAKDEIGLLANSFGLMAVRLKELYGNLETKVKEQTAELSKEVEDLESSKKATVNLLEDLETERNKVEAARKAAEEKLNEVERLNKIMVDRELVMIELKKKIRELEAK